jgi:hypothetical protein
MHDLRDLINQFENVANELKVVVFDNANLDFYMHLPISFVKPVLMLGLPGLNFYQSLCNVYRVTLSSVLPPLQLGGPIL